VAALKPPAKAEAPELEPKLVNTLPVLAALAKAVTNGAVAAGEAAFPNAGKSEVGGGTAALPEPPAEANAPLVNASPAVVAGAGAAPKIEVDCAKGDVVAGAVVGGALALLLKPNREVDPSEDVRDAPKTLPVALGCEAVMEVTANRHGEECVGGVGAVVAAAPDENSRDGLVAAELANGCAACVGNSEAEDAVACMLCANIAGAADPPSASAVDADEDTALCDVPGRAPKKLDVILKTEPPDVAPCVPTGADMNGPEDTDSAVHDWAAMSGRPGG
jgi:hypothetical protein